jgi:hypothetical protein
MALEIESFNSHYLIPHSLPLRHPEELGRLRHGDVRIHNDDQNGSLRRSDVNVFASQDDGRGRELECHVLETDKIRSLAVVIKSEKGQLYYQTDDEFGICPYESLEDKIKSGIIIGDAAEEAVSRLKDKTVRAIPVADFRDAKHLLNFSHLINQESRVVPLYISHSANYA